MRPALSFPSGGSMRAGLQSKGSMTLIWSLVFATICFDSILAPALNTIAPVFSCGLLLLLLLRQEVARSETEAALVVRFPDRWRLVAFVLLHVAAVVMARLWQTRLLGPPTETGWRLALVAATKYLILFPTILLMPLRQWRSFARLHRSELSAAVLALVTFFPYRIFHTLWPWYSQFIGHVAYRLAHPFVNGLQLIPSGSPVLVGPALDVTVIPDCGGLGAIKLFQVVFAIILIFDWNSLNKLRALIGYWLGMVLMLAANVVRIALLVIIGNQGFPEWIVKHHITASWIFLTVALAMLMLAGYHLLFPSREVVNASSVLASRIEIYASSKCQEKVT